MTISISLTKGIVDRHHVIRVRQAQHEVVMLVDNKTIVVDTPAAVKAGIALATLAGKAQNNEIVTFTYSGETLNLSPKHAQKLAGALIKKADLADDFQRTL